MLCVSLAVICDYGVGISWLNSWPSYPGGGLIIFNPLDVLQPNLHAGGQSLPIQPNIQSITLFNKVSFIFFTTREFIHGLKPKRIPTHTKKKVLGFLQTQHKERLHTFHKLESPPPPPRPLFDCLPELFPVTTLYS